MVGLRIAEGSAMMASRDVREAGRRVDPMASAPMNHVLHVVTVAEGLPLPVFDATMTAIERALVDLGATRIWVDGTRPLFAVMAEFPDTDEVGTDGQ